MPTKTKTKPVEPLVVPDADPERRLNPERLCPAQKEKVTRTVRDI